MPFNNIADYLTEMARTRPASLALAVQRGTDRFREYTYAELDEACTLLASGLRQHGVGPGTRVVVMVRPGFEFFTAAFALFRIGAILVAVDPGMGTRQLKRCLAEASPAAFIGSLRAHLARVLLGWCKSSLKLRVATGWPVPLPGLIRLEEIRDAGAGLPARADPVVSPTDTAAILFTSGSTGTPKGAEYTHANFLAQITALKDLYGIVAGEIDLATFPLFALYAPALGMTSVLPDMDYTRPGSAPPARIFSAIRRYRATTMFGSPALLDRVGRAGLAGGARLNTLKRVLSAGAPVTPAILGRFARLLEPGVEIHTPYGATEALPVSSIGSAEVLETTRALTEAGRGICVGRPVLSIEASIIAISDRPVSRWHDGLRLAAGRIGEIVVRGPQVTRRYHNRPQADALAKIRGEDDQVYHRMGDTGYLDDEGRLWFCGRKSHRVEHAGRTWFSICCEGVFNVHEKVRRSALIGLERGGATLPALCVELEPAHRGTERAALKRELREIGSRFEHTRDIREIFFHPGFPVDIRHNAKIDRGALAAWASGRRS